MSLLLRSASDHIPRFIWRVESTRSRHYLPGLIQDLSHVDLQNLEDDGKRNLGSYISAHMTGHVYNAPVVITSLTGSLLWALNYAQWLVRMGEGNVQVHLVDSLNIPEDRIYPAPFLAAFLDVAPRNIPWHDDPYHEYFVFGGTPVNAILGSVHVHQQSLAVSHINTLLPGFDQFNQRDGLYASLDQFIMKHQNSIFRNAVRLADVTDDDVLAAGLLAEEFLSPTLNPGNQFILFQMTMMFLHCESASGTRMSGP